MKKILLSLFLFSVITSIGFSQNFAINLLPGDVLDNNGLDLNHTTQSSLGLKLFYAQTSPFSNAITDALVPDASEFASYGDLNWTEMQDTVNFGFEFWTSPGWDGVAGSRVAGTSGNTVLVAITSGSTVASTTAGDLIGLLASKSPLAEVGDATLTINSFNVLAGVSGSVQVVTAVPEPSIYAALAGILALGWVMVRRRRA